MNKWGLNPLHAEDSLIKGDEEPLDSQEWLPDQKRVALVNIRDIERTIPKLLRTFARKEMRDKYNREFGSLLKQQQSNEIDSFNE